MLLLTASGDLVRVITSASADIEVHASWVDNVSGTITPGRTNTASITSNTTTTVVAGPSSGQRNVKHLNIRNNHGSTACDVTVFHTDGTTQEDIIKCTLLPGEMLVLGQDGRWTHYDSNGGEYPVFGLATRGQVEAAIADDVMIPPGVQHYHPGHPKCWVKNGVTGNILNSYNIASVTDTGAGLCAPQISTDFTGVNWVCLVTVERTSTALTITNLKYANVRFALQVASGVTLECWDGSVTSAVVEDPQAWHMVGLGSQV